MFLVENKALYSLKKRYKYDDNGKIVEQTEYFDKEGNLEEQKMHNYTYDENGRVKKIFSVYRYQSSEYKCIVYKYNENGTLSELVKYPALFVMDAVSLESTKHSIEEEKLIWKKTFAYDKNGKLTEVCRYDENGAKESRAVLECDKRGNVTDETVYDEGEFTESTKCLITYRK